MRLIIEVDQDKLRAYRITVPDDARITWQGANPTKQYAGDSQVLRVYVGKNQIMAIPSVLTWRVDSIEVEEFVTLPDVIGKTWVERKDAPMNYHPEQRGTPTPVEDGGNMTQGMPTGRKRRIA